MTLSIRLYHLPPLTPLTSADTMRSVQIDASAHCQLGRRASVSCVVLADTPETTCSIPDLASPPSCLPSLEAVLLPAPSAAGGDIGTMKALTPAAHTLADRSLRLLRLAFPTFRPQPRDLPAGRFVSRLSASGCFQASPRMSRLATASRRIRFVLLRTAGSPPVALHPRRSYLQFRSQRPAPARTCTVLTKRPHGRTHPGEGRDLWWPWIPACAGMTNQRM